MKLKIVVLRPYIDLCMGGGGNTNFIYGSIYDIPSEYIWDISVFFSFFRNKN